MTKISQLPASTVILPSGLIHVDEAGVSKSVPVSLIGGMIPRTLPVAGGTLLSYLDRAGLYSPSSAATWTLTAAASLGAGWFVILSNASTGNLVLDPNGSETINGATTLTLAPGDIYILACDGVNFKATFLRAGPLLKPIGLSSLSVANAADAHGSLSVIHQHQHAADGADTYFYMLAVPTPLDAMLGAASEFTLNVLWSSTAAGNNVNMQPFIEGLKAGDTAPTSLLNPGAAVQAAPAVANTQKLTTYSFTALPSLDGSIGVLLGFVRTAGGDTNTGQVSLWDTWIKYKARG